MQKNTRKRKEKNWVLTHKKIATLAFGISISLLVGLYFIAAKVVYVNDAANQASMVQVRELIVMAVENLKKNVPVDPKTGDLYFPESSLFLPNPKSSMKLTYAWYPADESSSSQDELSVSLLQVPGTTNLYSARNIDEMFRAVPKLQSCSRGVKLLPSKTTDDNYLGQLKKVVALQNGKELYMYAEKDCPELDEVVDLLSNIRSY